MRPNTPFGHVPCPYNCFDAYGVSPLCWPPTFHSKASLFVSKISAWSLRCGNGGSARVQGGSGEGSAFRGGSHACRAPDNTNRAPVTTHKVISGASCCLFAVGQGCQSVPGQSELIHCHNNFCVEGSNSSRLMNVYVVVSYSVDCQFFSYSSDDARIGPTIIHLVRSTFFGCLPNADKVRMSLP